MIAALVSAHLVHAYRTEGPDVDGVVKQRPSASSSALLLAVETFRHRAGGARIQAPGSRPRVHHHLPRHALPAEPGGRQTGGESGQTGHLTSRLSSPVPL